MQDSIAQYDLFEKETIQSVTLLEVQGFCNENYLVITDKKKYIARKLIRTDIDRNLEFKIQGLAYNAGITAKPYIYDTVNSVMLFEFIKGEHKTSLSHVDINALAQTLQKLHTIKMDVRPTILEIKHKTDEITDAFKTIERYEKEYVLCHNDLNPQNLLWFHGVNLIDWEYSGVNDRYFDLASVCVEFKLDESMQIQFLEEYFVSNAYSTQKLEAYKIIYSALCTEWFDKNHEI